MIANREECVTEDELGELLAGRLPVDRFAGALAHVEKCPDCLAAVEAARLTDSLAWLRESKSAQPRFDAEPECQVMLGQLLLQPTARGAESDRQVLPVESLGPYRLLKWLGSGGMGAVYLAEHERLKRLTAIKLLPRDKLRETGWLDRFNREMTSIAALEHANVVRAIDAGDQGGWHYLVMEYLDGADLGQITRSLGPLPIGTACELARQAALGLQAIHDLGMTHRDVKPSNLFLTRQGVVKLLDLGLVLSGESPLATDERLTTVGHLMGTLPYMAREQLLDASNVDWRADIYSLGATLCRLITGRTPFGPANNIAQAIQLISSSDCPTMRSLKPDLPVELAAMIDSMLSHDRSQRPRSAREVAERLSAFADSESTQPLARTALRQLEPTHPTLLSHDLRGLPQPLITSTTSSTTPPRSRWPLWLAAALLPFAFLAGIVITVMTDKGTLVIESDEPGITVKVTQGDKTVEELKVENQSGVVRLSSGKYTVELAGVVGDGLTLSDSQVTILRGQKELLRVRRQDTAIANPIVGDASENQSAADGVVSKGNSYQGKSFSYWMATLEREKDIAMMAQAMQAVFLLAETDDEKLAAASQVLKPARRLGSVHVGSRPQGAGTATFDHSGWYMAELVEGYANFLSEPGLVAICNELESGNQRSAEACTLLVGVYAYKLRHESRMVSKEVHLSEHLQKLASSESGRQTLERLDRALEKWGSQFQDAANHITMRLRVSLLQLLDKDLSEQPQIVARAKAQLEQAESVLANCDPKFIESSLFVVSPLTPDDALTIHESLKGNISLPVLLGLMEPIETQDSEFEGQITAALREIARLHPKEASAAAMAQVQRSAEATRPMHSPFSTWSKERLQIFQKLLLETGDTLLSVRGLVIVAGKRQRYILEHTEIEDCLRQLAMRLAREAQADTGTLGVKKDALAIGIFSALGIPKERLAEATELLVAKDRQLAPRVDGERERGSEWLRSLAYTLIDATPTDSSFIVETAMTTQVHLPNLVKKHPEAFLAAWSKWLEANTLRPSQARMMDLVFREIDGRRDALQRMYSSIMEPLSRVKIRLQEFVESPTAKPALETLRTAHKQALKRLVEQRPDNTPENYFALSHLVIRALILDRFLDQADHPDDQVRESLDLLFRWTAESPWEKKPEPTWSYTGILPGLAIYYDDHFDDESLPLKVILVAWQDFSKVKNCEAIKRLFENLHRSRPDEFCECFVGDLERVARELSELASVQPEAEVQNRIEAIYGYSSPCGAWYSTILRKVLENERTKERAAKALKEIANRAPEHIAFELLRPE